MSGQARVPLISVVLTTYNSAATIGSVLEALTNQDFPLEKVELIVVDDGSRDKTLDIVKGFIESHGRKFADVRLVVHDRNYGVSRARNDGMRLSRGSYILILDHDVIMPPGTLRALYEYLEKAPSRVAVVIPLHNPVGAGRIQRWQYLLYRGRVTTTNAITSCALIRRGLVDEIGYYDETLGPPFTIYEDIEYGARAISKGYEIVLLGTIEVIHDAREGINGSGGGEIRSGLATRLAGLLRSLSSPRYRYALMRYLRSSPAVERVRWGLYAVTPVIVLVSVILSLALSPLWLLAPLTLLSLLYLDVLRLYMNPKYIHVSLAYSALALSWRIARSVMILIEAVEKVRTHVVMG